MKTNLIKQYSIGLLVAMFGMVMALGAPYQKGDKVQAFDAKDQYGTAFTLKPEETRYLLVSHDMDTGKKANAVLSALGKEHLGKKKAVYVANIHGMPGIGRMFAIPKMKKYSHRIILGDDEKLIARFPEQKGKVTVLIMNAGKIKSVAYWNPETEALDEVLK